MENLSQGRHGAGMATASLVLGIVGIFVFMLIIPSILAVILGNVAIYQSKKNPNVGGGGMATAGFSMGLIGVGLALIFYWVIILS